MNLLVVGHAYLSPINKKKWKAYNDCFPEDAVTVVTPKSWKDALFSLDAELDDAEKVLYRSFPVSQSGNEVLHRYSWLDVWNVVRAAKPDLLLVEQGINAFSYFQFIVVCLLLGRKIPFLFFTWVNWKHQWGWKYRLFWSWLESFNLFFSTGAIVGNPEAQQLLKDRGFEQSVLVSPQLGIDEPENRPNLVQTRKIGFVGRLTPEKGVECLLTAFARVSTQFSGIQLIIVGSGPQGLILKNRVVDLGISQKVVFTGSVDHYSAIELIETLDILILPSIDTVFWKEQFGHVIIEAMALGVAVIGSDAGAISWVIQDAGLVFAQNNVNDLSNKLALLLSDEALRLQLIMRGQELVREKYSHEVIAKNIGRFLHSFVSKEIKQTGSL